MQPPWSDGADPRQRLSYKSIAGIEMELGNKIVCVLRHIFVDEMKSSDTSCDEQC